jgi:hypothetical protein
MATNAEVRAQIEEAAAFVNGKCPFTNKTPTEPRCTGQLSLRMLSGGVCTDFCHAKYDDEKIRRVGGTYSLD